MSDDDGRAARQAVLASLRAVTDAPAVTEPLRKIGVTELPAGALLVVRACVDPWRYVAYLSLGPTPYTWEFKAGGHRLANQVAVRFAHPDGRSAVATWITDVESYIPALVGMSATEARKVAPYFPTPIPKLEGPKLPAQYRPGWSDAGAWHWRRHPTTGYPVDIPRAIGALELRAMVGDGAPALRLINAPTVEQPPAPRPRPVPRKASAMPAVDPDAWAPQPIRWDLVRVRDLFLDPNGQPWAVTARVDLGHAIDITAVAGAETRRKLMAPDERVPVLLPLAERRGVAHLVSDGIGVRVIDRTLEVAQVDRVAS